MSAGRRAIAGSTGPDNTAGLAFGGETPGLSVVTDEWSNPVLTIQEFDLS